MKKYLHLPVTSKIITPSVFVMVFLIDFDGKSFRFLKWAVAYDLEAAINKISVYHNSKHYSPGMQHISLHLKIGVQEIKEHFKRCN